ncbi:MAG: hypothetical protein ACRD4X_18100 [Candidatus Acidiferrales bacterium]
MDSALQVETALGAGRGALIVSIFGCGWLVWGLFIIGAFTPVRIVALGVIELAFLDGAVYFIRKGRTLRKQYPRLPQAVTRNTAKWYWIIVAAEVVAIAIAANVAIDLRRPELIPDWIAILVGLHFLPLAKIFHARSMAYVGAAMVLWSILCWIAFRSDALAAAVVFGAGVLVWIASGLALRRARAAVRSLSHQRPATIPG